MGDTPVQPDATPTPAQEVPVTPSSEMPPTQAQMGNVPPADTSNLPLTPQGAATQAMMQPQAPAPVQPPSKFDRIVATLQPQKNIHVDPTTGKMTGDPNYSKGSLAAHIVAGALLGFAAGYGKENGGERGAQIGMQLAQAPYQKAQADYEREQQAQVQKYQNAHLNAETANLAANTRVIGIKALDDITAQNEPVVRSLVDSGNIEADASGNPLPVTKEDLLAGVKSGKYSPGEQLGVQYGKTLVDGESHATYVVVKDPKAPVTVDQATADRWAQNGVSFPKEAVGKPIPMSSYTNYNNQANTRVIGDSTLSVLRQDAGSNADLLKKIPATIDTSIPGMNTALKLYSQYLLGAKMDPIEAMHALSTDKSGPGSSRLLTQAFGGLSTLQALSDQRGVNKVAADEKAKAAAGLPAKEADQKFQADEGAKNRNAARTATIEAEQGKKTAADIEKLDSAYQDTVRQGNNIRQGVAAAKDKDALASALLPLEGALFVTTANGNKRINTTEIEGIKLAGSTKDRIEAWVNGKISGDVVPDDIKQGMLAMVNQYQKNAYTRYQQGVDSATARNKGNVAPVNYDGSIGGAIQQGGSNGSFFGTGTVPTK